MIYILNSDDLRSSDVYPEYLLTLKTAPKGDDPRWISQYCTTDKTTPWWCRFAWGGGRRGDLHIIYGEMYL